MLLESIPENELPAKNDRKPEPPISLLRALRMFFITAVASPRYDNEKNRSMFVHPDRRIGIQKEYFDWIVAITQRWNDIFRLPEGDPERSELEDEFEADYLNIRGTVPEIPPLADIIEDICTELSRVCITQINSETGSEVIWENAFCHILIGGDKLQRGYTVKGLIVTYMSRGPGTWTADTIQQRARFFGYKKKYLNYCRVFLEGKVKEYYKDYVDHEESLRDQIVVFRGRSTKELRRSFILDKKYKPTRQNILTEPYYRIQFNDRWLRQRTPHLVGNIAENVSLVEEFQNRRAWKNLPSYNSHRIADGVKIEELTELLIGLEFGPNDSMDFQVAFYALEHLKKCDPRQSAKLILMGPIPRKRTLSEGEVQIFQGRSVNYPGDSLIYDPNDVTLQIHWIKVVEEEDDGSETKIEDRVPALAIHFPGDFNLLDVLYQPKQSQ
jgi:hypothetical protein